MDLRLIPARAGKTLWVPIGAALPWAHPRACGENGLEGLNQACRDGSSPRVRGKLLLGGLVGDVPGLIPARAGKTWGRGSTSSSRWAHPRACGENAF